MQPTFDENEYKQEGRKKPSIDEVIQALEQAEGDIVPFATYFGLSDVSSSEVQRLRPTWGKLKPVFRRQILTQLAESSEADFEVDYREIGLLGLQDEYGGARAAAIEILWADESPEFLSKLIEMAEGDESPDARAAAAIALGRFILLGEYEEIPEEDGKRAKETVIKLLMNEREPIEVRRRALEAAAHSHHPILSKAIQEAYESGEPLMKISAIFAMGRSYNKEWAPIVLKELKNPDAEILYEAARAAGELELEEAVFPLGQVAIEDDREVKNAAIWSLGEIGGREATRILTALAQDAEDADDDDLLELIEDAISNANMIGGIIGFDNLDDLNDLDDLDDLDD